MEPTIPGESQVYCRPFQQTISTVTFTMAELSTCHQKSLNYTNLSSYVWLLRLNRTDPNYLENVLLYTLPSIYVKSWIKWKWLNLSGRGLDYSKWKRSTTIRWCSKKVTYFLDCIVSVVIILFDLFCKSNLSGQVTASVALNTFEALNNYLTFKKYVTPSNERIILHWRAF